jgi:hypothetical protein
MKMNYEMKISIAKSIPYIRPERERRLRRKGVMEEEGFKIFLWKLETGRAKGDEFETQTSS